ncbi:MAG TPA: DUF1259 domain-containing protein [Gemmatimonadaceae bacterium]|nr:DUF1259 domain-containing protein [Gemmatimonadaceae bacterium]
MMSPRARQLLRHCLATLAVASFISVFAGAAAHAQQASSPAWAEVGRILGTPETPTGGYHRYNLPRRDLTVRIGDVTLAAALALGGWAGFDGPPDDATVMGDLVVTTTEMQPVLGELARQHIPVTAVHNHLAGESPAIFYVHIHAQGVATDLAARIDHAVALTATPRPVGAAPAGPVTIDTATVFRVLGSQGRAQGNVAQLSFMLVQEPVSMHGHAILPSLSYATPINVQAVSSTRLVATGDFAVLGRQLGSLLTALAAHGITATAVHSHLVDEAPHVYYVHFWADGASADVLSGLRAALDAAR